MVKDSRLMLICPRRRSAREMCSVNSIERPPESIQNAKGNGIEEGDKSSSNETPPEDRCVVHLGCGACSAQQGPPVGQQAPQGPPTREAEPCPLEPGSLGSGGLGHQRPGTEFLSPAGQFLFGAGSPSPTPPVTCHLLGAGERYYQHPGGPQDWLPDGMAGPWQPGYPGLEPAGSLCGVSPSLDEFTPRPARVWPRPPVLPSETPAPGSRHGYRAL